MDRHLAYWDQCLAATGGSAAVAPVVALISEIEGEVADLERRLNRQVINLEADDTTPHPASVRDRKDQ